MLYLCSEFVVTDLCLRSSFSIKSRSIVRWICPYSSFPNLTQNSGSEGAPTPWQRRGKWGCYQARSVPAAPLGILWYSIKVTFVHRTNSHFTLGEYRTVENESRGNGQLIENGGMGYGIAFWGKVGFGRVNTISSIYHLEQSPSRVEHIWGNYEGLRLASRSQLRNVGRSLCSTRIPMRILVHSIPVRIVVH